MADKTYTEVVIQDNPFPQEVSVPFAVISQLSTGGSYSESKIEEQVFPTKKIATELISNVLNTQSRKILQEFQFTKSGALQIGEYVSGTSGDIKLSPDGLVGRNKSNETTFAIDGTTGDATFKGTILAGSVIAEGALMGGLIDIGGADATSFHVDVDGNMWLGAATYAAAPFKVSNAGAVTGSDLTITGGSITGVTIAIGSGNSIFKADSNGIYLGNATFASAPFRVTMVGALTAENIAVTGGSINLGSGTFIVDNSGNVTANSYSLNSGNITNVANGIIFKNTYGVNYYNSTNTTAIGSLTVDASNILALFNTGAGNKVTIKSNNDTVNLYANNTEFARGQTDGSLLIATIAGSGGTINLADDITVASGQNLTFAGTQGSINCGNINCDTVEMNNARLENPSSVLLQARDTGFTPADREFGNEDNGTNQRLRMKFANNGTQWQVNLTAVCTPVNKADYDPVYFEKYELRDDLDESRFALKYPNQKRVQPEYRKRPLSHFPSMGDLDGTAWKQHMDAMWKRPWLPMKKIPARMETMGQYPYPPVHSSLIGEGESMANIYQLISHAYNQLQQRCDMLEAEVRRLVRRLDGTI